MARSTLTLSDYRLEAEDLLGLDYGSANNDLTDTTILIAADKYLKFYRTIEILGEKEFGLKETSTISIPVDGYDLSNISDLNDNVQGFKVFLGEVGRYNRILPAREGSERTGYYIKGSTIYINNATTDTDVVFQYQKNPQRISNSASDLSAITPEIDEIFEDMLTLYIAHRYYTRSGDNPQAAEDALNDSRNLTVENFNLKRRNAHTTI